MKGTQGTLVSLVIVVVISLIGIRELFLPGFFDTHDGFTHIMRLAHFDEALRNGQFPVRWLQTAMAGYGSPVFNFNYSLPYYVGSLFHALGVSYQSSIEAVFILGYILSAIFCFLFLKELLRDNLAASVGSLLYLWAPYRFTNIFIRGALGEATSFLFFPLLSWLVIKTYKSSRKSFPLWTSVIWLFFILSHNIMALIGLGLFFFYVIYLEFIEKTGWRVFKSSIFVFILGLSLSAFFWLPSILENKFTNYLNAYHFSNSFPSINSIVYSKWQYALATPENQKLSMSFQLGLVHLLIPILFLASFFIIRSSRRNFSLKSHGLFFFIVFLFSIFLTNKTSTIIYNNLSSFASLIHFPWRFLEIATLSTSILASIFVFLMPKFKVAASLMLIILSVLLYWPYSKIITSRFSLTDNEYSSMTKTNTGLLPETEFAPVGESYFQLLQLVEDRGPASLHSFFEDETSRSIIMDTQNKHLSHTASITTSQPVEIRANTFYFPGWKLYVDNQESLIDKDQYGLIKFIVNPGSHDVRLIFKNTPIRTLANAISIATLILLVFLLIKENRKRFKRGFLSKFSKILSG